VDKKNKDLMEYKISYVTTNRKLVISFQKKFPHIIESWTESYIVNGTKVENKGTRKKTILSDYWNKNRNIDKKLRKELGLD
ncbi:MAG: hypothetical protein MK212_03705, partial [Saprospiraceae bacterium]|nr:hypothetical protein [Saprospiraceae bacterium]